MHFEKWCGEPRGKRQKSEGLTLPARWARRGAAAGTLAGGGPGRDALGRRLG